MFNYRKSLIWGYIAPQDRIFTIGFFCITIVTFLVSAILYNTDLQTVYSLHCGFLSMICLVVTVMSYFHYYSVSKQDFLEWLEEEKCIKIEK